MTRAPLSVRGTDEAQRTWFLGGVLLLASVVLTVTALPGGLTLRKAFFAAAMLVFALGIRGVGSITARQPLGTSALVLLALWTLIVTVLTEFVFVVDETSTWLLGFSLISSIVEFALALVAVAQIARADVVPRPWNRAPAWALLVVSVPWLVEQVLGRAAPRTAMDIARVESSVDGIILSGVPIFLGVLAIVLADRLHPAVVGPRSD